MFEDPDLQGPSSQSLNENYSDQASTPQEPIKAPASPNHSCDTPEIQVIIKEEEEGWTVSENHESLSPERDETAAGTCSYFKAFRKEDSISYGVKRHQRVCQMEKCFQESDGHSICGQSSTATERRQRNVPKGFNEKLELSCIRDHAAGNMCQCNKTGENPFPFPGRDTSPGHKENTKSHPRAHGGAECPSQEQRTTLCTEEELRQPSLPAPYQTDSPHCCHLTSHGLKMASASLSDQALHLTVRLQAEEREVEEEQDEEIGGLINSDGEVVEWDAKDNSAQSSDCTESPQCGKGDVLSGSQHQGLNQRHSCSPTLIMEVVEDDDDEVEDQKKRIVKKTSDSPFHSGKRPKGRKKVPVERLDNSDTEQDSPAITAKKRGRRKKSQPPVSSGKDLQADSRISRRTRRQRNICTIAEPEELNSKSLRIAAKQPHKRRKTTKPSAEGQGEKTAITTGKKQPGRKVVRVPIEIPPELLKTPKEKIEYRCSVCGKEFPHAYKLERHELIHTGEKPYCCSVCGRGFNQKGNLKTHYKVHLGRKGAVDFDEEVNPSASELSEYLKSLPGESRIRSTLRCPECGKDCESHSALQAHHVTAHSEASAEPDAVEHSASQFLLCRRCGIQFSEKEKLEEHLKTHIKEKRYSCPDCGKKFINESYIQIHQRIHTGEKPFLCSQCGRGFHTASSLKLHEMQHSGERPFACSICGKTFRINSYLTAHYQTHMKDRPFICSVCGKGYSRSEELKVHNRLHTGERPYECVECGKSFIYRQGLRQHQRTHAGRRIGPTRQLGRPKQRARLDI